MDLTERIERVEPSPTLSITAKANELKAEGVDVVSFSAGEPDFDTPEAVVEAAKEALDAGKTRYTASRGIKPLREAIAEDYRLRGREPTADNVVVTVGGKQALYNATQVLFEDGDDVIVPAPYWVSYPAQLKLAGATPVEVSCGLDSNFKLEPDRLDRALSKSNAAGLILCTPSNPTGAVYSADELADIAEVLDNHPRVTVLFDAIYDQLFYGGDEGELSPDLVDVAPGLQERVVTINGFSKAYAMTGWRLGYAIGSSEIIDAMAKLQSQSTSNATTFVQHAALEALELSDALLADRRQTFRERRDRIVEGLNAIEGIECPTPGGAFYAFPDFSSYIGEGNRFEDDFDLADFLLEEAHVAVVPGSAFGAAGHLRLSYATSGEIIEEGLDRIQKALAG
jgi:aspartate aminotransferase